MKNYDWITFDCYGTLIDWESGISEAFQRIAKSSGVPFDRGVILRLFAKFEAEEEQIYRRYRDVLNRVARRICVELGLRATDFDFLAESLPRWRPFVDTNVALERLARRFRLGILSNIDDDLLTATRRHFSVPFELVVTAENVGSYKPARKHFDEARRKIGTANWIHAAQSYYHDLVPCSQLQIDSAWINRNQEPNKDPKNTTPRFNGLNLIAFVNWMEEAM